MIGNVHDGPTLDPLNEGIAPRVVGGVLACPLCGGGNLHLLRIHVSARREDGPFNEVAVSPGTGAVSTHLPDPGPQGDRVGEGRRDRAALTFGCEQCPARSFALVFTQHKGDTYAEWTDTTDPAALAEETVAAYETNVKSNRRTRTLPTPTPERNPA